MGDSVSLAGAFLRLILFFCIGALLLYAVYVLYFYAGQRAMLFPRHLVPVAPPVFAGENASALSIATPDGTVEAWLLWPSRGEGPIPLVIVGHGNGEIIDQWIDAVEPLRNRGMAVLLVEYPGYGRSAGQPSEHAIVEIFVQAYDAALALPEIDEARVIFFGRSVGGGAVAQLAARRPSAGMILLSTFTSVRDMAASYRLPGRLARDPFDTLSIVRAYTRPLLILHGEHDPIIPFAHSQRLHEAAPHSEWRPLPCGHNDCVRDWEEFWSSIEDFWRGVFAQE